MRLVDDLLDVSRIARGKVDLHKERTSIAEVVKRAAETTQPLFQERQQPLGAGRHRRSLRRRRPDAAAAGVREPADERLEVQRSGRGRRRLREARGRSRRDPRSRPRDRHPPGDDRARVRSVRAAAAGAGPRRRGAGSRPRNRQEPRGLARRLGARRERRPGQGQRVHRDPAVDAGGGRRRAARGLGSGDGRAPRIPGLSRARRRRQRGRRRDARGLARVDGPRRARRARRPRRPSTWPRPSTRTSPCWTSVCPR